MSKRCFWRQLSNCIHVRHTQIAIVKYICERWRKNNDYCMTSRKHWQWCDRGKPGSYNNNNNELGWVTHDVTWRCTVH